LHKDSRRKHELKLHNKQMCAVQIQNVRQM
jgi:hypothetical protein